MTQKMRPVTVAELNLPTWLTKDIEALNEFKGSTAIDTFEEFRQVSRYLHNLERGIKQGLARLGGVDDVTSYLDYVPRFIDLLPSTLRREIVAIQRKGDASKLEGDERLEIAELLSKLRDQLETSTGRLMTLSSTDTSAFVWNGYRSNAILFEIEDGKIFRSDNMGNREIVYNGSYQDPDGQLKLGRAIKLACGDKELWVLLEGNNRHAAEFQWGNLFQLLSGLDPSPAPTFLHVALPPDDRMRTKDIGVAKGGEIYLVFGNQKGETVGSWSTASLTSYFPVPLNLGLNPTD